MRIDELLPVATSSPQSPTPRENAVVVLKSKNFDFANDLGQKAANGSKSCLFDRQPEPSGATAPRWLPGGPIIGLHKLARVTEKHSIVARQLVVVVRRIVVVRSCLRGLSCRASARRRRKSQSRARERRQRDARH